MNLLTKIKILNKLKIFNELRFINYKIANSAPERLKFYSQFIDPGDLCFDIGANIGQKADIFLKLKARVVAVEPQSQCITFLQKKYKNNTNITIIHKAVDSHIGTKKIFLCEANALSSLSSEWVQKAKSTLFAGFEWTGTEVIQTTTLDALISEFGVPKFCKIDVEGLELNVLKGLSQVIKYIIFEFTNENFDACLQSLDHLRSIGHFEANMSPAERTNFRLPHWADAAHFTEAINQLPAHKRYGDIYIHFI